MFAQRAVCCLDLIYRRRHRFPQFNADQLKTYDAAEDMLKALDSKDCIATVISADSWDASLRGEVNEGCNKAVVRLSHTRRHSRICLGSRVEINFIDPYSRYTERPARQSSCCRDSISTYILPPLSAGNLHRMVMWFGVGTAVSLLGDQRRTSA